jgi:hypothetical protein
MLLVFNPKGCDMAHAKNEVASSLILGCVPVAAVYGVEGTEPARPPLFFMVEHPRTASASERMPRGDHIKQSPPHQSALGGFDRSLETILIIVLVLFLLGGGGWYWGRGRG